MTSNGVRIFFLSSVPCCQICCSVGIRVCYLPPPHSIAIKPCGERVHGSNCVISRYCSSILSAPSQRECAKKAASAHLCFKADIAFLRHSRLHNCTLKKKNAATFIRFFQTSRRSCDLFPRFIIDLRPRDLYPFLIGTRSRDLYPLSDWSQVT